MSLIKCEECGKETSEYAEACPHCGMPLIKYVEITPKTSHNRLAAALIAIFLGGLGLHKFYLGQVGMGVIYLLLSWTLIPAILGFLEGICYLSMSESDFEQKYV